MCASGFCILQASLSKHPRNVQHVALVMEKKKFSSCTYLVELLNFNACAVFFSLSSLPSILVATTVTYFLKAYIYIYIYIYINIYIYDLSVLQLD